MAYKRKQRRGKGTKRDHEPRVRVYLGEGTRSFEIVIES